MTVNLATQVKKSFTSVMANKLSIIIINNNKSLYLSVSFI